MELWRLTQEPWRLTLGRWRLHPGAEEAHPAAVEESFWSLEAHYELWSLSLEPLMLTKVQ